MGGPRADGAALAGIGTLLVGSSFAASSLLTQFPFFSGQALRFALGGVGLLVIALTARARWPRPTIWELAVLALLAATAARRVQPRLPRLAAVLGAGRARRRGRLRAAGGGACSAR